ncbi:Nucleoside phosphorylase domain protein [Metarhizium album ARSEF 1941]|uniref:Nucleoside phosphorylase domain protein n=1 Tax=Metarhizium album (strain ARSEF 1941) TaxID=1081103 RepID=A0A0B2X8F9_METAS|nr:Nucleoside phosphorylase domain protein [Metarhizium album ARSEF 1941]KHO02068.1 Nucleoside phosphorylase domain protein [Metarhizium album ARSEF 1941]
MPDAEDFTVGWICALDRELVAAQFIAVLPYKEHGKSSAAVVANDMQRSFPSIRIGLMVGIGGGAPSAKNDVQLGDIVVSCRGGGNGGVLHHDYGKVVQNRDFTMTGHLNQPPQLLLLRAVSALEARYDRSAHQIRGNVEKALEKITRREKYRRPAATTDRLHLFPFTHPQNTTQACGVVCGDDASNLIVRKERSRDGDDPVIHYGIIASADTLMKDATVRDEMAREHNILCFEMEAAGLMNHLPCLVIRGISDYSDSHKNDEWQGYAAMVAAAYARDLVTCMNAQQVRATTPIKQLLSDGKSRMNILRGSRLMDSARAQVNRVRSATDRGEDQRILRWITEADHAAHFNTFIRGRHSNTLKWLKDSDKFQKW